MKTIILEPKEFYNFKVLALSISLFFLCSVSHGLVTIQADAAQLEEWGY